MQSKKVIENGELREMINEFIQRLAVNSFFFLNTFLRQEYH